MPVADEWLAYAAADLTAARLAVDADLHAIAGFHIQQAVEKILKSALVDAGLTPPKTHDLEALAALTQTKCPFSADELTDMILWATSGRYPGFLGDLPSLEALRSRIARTEAWLETLS